MVRNLVKACIVALLVLCCSYAPTPVSASGGNCMWEIANRSEDTHQPLMTATATWLQWLNQGQFTCVFSGTTTHVRCTKSGSQAYDFYYYGCNADGACSAAAYDSHGWRDTAQFSVDSSGQAWNFNWDNYTTYGYVTSVCVPDTNHLNNPCIMTYGTCLNW